MFDKGSEPKWSQKIHVIKEVKAHSVLLDNDKWYKYYQVMNVNLTEQKHVKALNELAGTMKNIKILQTFKREDAQTKMKREGDII